MLYWLLYEQLYPHFSPFPLFRYVTFRTAFASMTALFLCLVLGPWLIHKLREFQIGQHIREEGPKSHQKKAGTPTMGGVLIVVSIVVPTLLWANLAQPLRLGRAVRPGGLRRHRLLGRLLQGAQASGTWGLTGRKKFLLQVPGGAAGRRASCWSCTRMGLYSTGMNVPFFKQLKPDMLIDAWLGNPFTYPLAFVFFFGFLVLVIVGSSNAVNLTDGLDGLAIGLMIIAVGRHDGADLRQRPRAVRHLPGPGAAARRRAS